MSGVTFHLTQALFGPGGLDNTIKSNPNMIGKLLSGLTKGGGFPGSKNDEPMANGSGEKHNNKDLLDLVRKHNRPKKTEDSSVARSSEKTVDESRATTTASNDDGERQSLTRERMLLAEQKTALDNQMKKQNELYHTQMEQLRRQQIAMNTQSTKQNDDLYPGGKTQILSDAKTKPRFMNNIPKPTPIHRNKSETENLTDDNAHDLFGSEIKDSNRPSSKSVKFSPIKKTPTKKELDEIFESLDETSSIDISESGGSKKKNSISKPNNSLKKPQGSIKKPTNSATRSVGRKRNNTSESSSKQSNIVKL